MIYVYSICFISALVHAEYELHCFFRLVPTVHIDPNIPTQTHAGRFKMTICSHHVDFDLVWFRDLGPEEKKSVWFTIPIPLP